MFMTLAEILGTLTTCRMPRVAALEPKGEMGFSNPKMDFL